jgi:AraC-like DNA-binding protein
MMNTTPVATPVAVHIRSYGELRDADRHDFAQLVLPLSGSLLLDIEGRAGRLDLLRGAVVAPRAWHAQGFHGDVTANRSLIVDLDWSAVDPEVGARLLARPFPTLQPAARKLVEFMGIMLDAGQPAAATLSGWLPLLLDTLVLDAPRPASRLAALLARIEAEPGLPWSLDAMAKAAGLSVSRLHALFREELDASPHGWLLALRMARVREWLANTDEPIAALALRAGFGDQSALTRALKKSIGQTPAEFRRAHRRAARSRQENPPTPQ